MSLLLNMLSNLVIDSLPRSRRLLISWLQSPSAVTLEPKKILWDFRSQDLEKTGRSNHLYIAREIDGNFWSVIGGKGKKEKI